jgi:hypothetical protein
MNFYSSSAENTGLYPLGFSDFVWLFHREWYAR